MRTMLAMMVMLGVAATLFAATPKGFKQNAQDALAAGDYGTAEKWLKKWIEADPTDAISLYNLACCYAIGKKPQDALRTLTQATDAGWSDSSQANSDSDLQSLRTKKEFGELLKRMGHNAATRDGGYVVHYAAQERYGRYFVILPDEYDGTRSYPLVILLHGYGQSPLDFAPTAALISSHDYIYAIPEGGYPALESEGKGFSYLRENNNYVEDYTTATLAADWVMRVADDMKKRYPIAGERVWLVGFSQGAALAHATAALYPSQVAGYAAHGGYMIKGTITDDEVAKEKTEGVKVLITHGKEDPSVPIIEAQYAAGLLKKAGLDVTYAEMAVPHKFTADVGAKVEEWLRKSNEEMKK